MELLKLIGIYILILIFMLISTATFYQITQKQKNNKLNKISTYIGYIFVMLFFVLSLYKLTVNYLEYGYLDYFK